MKKHTRVISFSGKGGTGKTTTASLFVKAVRELGLCEEILVIDADPDANLATTLDVRYETTIGDVADKRKNLDASLPNREITAFLEGLRAQDETVAGWSDATLNKIRQVFVKCLEECGMYDRASEQLTSVLLDFELEGLIRANDDAAILPALGVMD